MPRNLGIGGSFQMFFNIFLLIGSCFHVYYLNGPTRFLLSILLLLNWWSIMLSQRRPIPPVKTGLNKKFPVASKIAWSFQDHSLSYIQNKSNIYIGFAHTYPERCVPRAWEFTDLFIGSSQEIWWDDFAVDHWLWQWQVPTTYKTHLKLGYYSHASAVKGKGRTKDKPRMLMSELSFSLLWTQNSLNTNLKRKAIFRNNNFPEDYG